MMEEEKKRQAIIERTVLMAFSQEALGTENHHDHQRGPEDQHAVFGQPSEQFRENGQQKGSHDDPGETSHSPENNHGKNPDGF